MPNIWALMYTRRCLGGGEMTVTNTNVGVSAPSLCAHYCVHCKPTSLCTAKSLCVHHCVIQLHPHLQIGAYWFYIWQAKSIWTMIKQKSLVFFAPGMTWTIFICFLQIYCFLVPSNRCFSKLSIFWLFKFSMIKNPMFSHFCSNI